MQYSVRHLYEFFSRIPEGEAGINRLKGDSPPKTKVNKKIAEEVAEIQSAGFHDMSGAPFVAVSTKESID